MKASILAVLTYAAGVFARGRPFTNKFDIMVTPFTAIKCEWGTKQFEIPGKPVYNGHCENFAPFASLAYGWNKHKSGEKDPKTYGDCTIYTWASRDCQGEAIGQGLQANDNKKLGMCYGVSATPGDMAQSIRVTCSK